MASEWERLETVKKQRLFQLMEYESMELANFEDWLFMVSQNTADSYVRSESFSIKRASNLLNRLSVSSKDDIIVELMRVRWKKCHYNTEFDADANWSKLLKRVPFPYERTFNAGIPSKDWMLKIADYISRYHYHEISTPEDLLGWGLDMKHIDETYSMMQERYAKQEQ